MNMTTTTDPAVAQLRLAGQTDQHAELTIPATNYRLRLAITSPVRGEVGKRVAGLIRCKAWKVDPVSVGGDYVEPVMGKPRRVQGHVIAHTADGCLVIRVCGTPFVGQFTDHCKLKLHDIPVGSRVGMDITGDPVFEQR